MRRLDLSLLVSSLLIFPMACGSSGTPAKDGGAGKDGGTDAAGSSGTDGGIAGTGGAAGADASVDKAETDTPVDTIGTTDGSAEAGDHPVDGLPDGLVDGLVDGVDAGLTPLQAQGSYLVSVLGCSGCHTPQLAGGGGPDTSKFLSGIECFANDTATSGCLSSANLTNDATGLKNLADQDIKAAFTAGLYPTAGDAGTEYLFANMPYYQYAFLTSGDADAIVAFLRTVAPVAHAVPANTGVFATRPTAPQWASVPLAALPSVAIADGGVDAATDAAVASTTNGKYFAALLCSTCHTVNTTATMPLQLDVSKAFEGGKTETVSVTVPADGGTDAGVDGGDAGATMSVSKQIESANLTPDPTGLAGWTAAQITTAITTAKDNLGRTICGMRALGSLHAQDATDVANYLQAIPPVANTVAPTCY